MSGSATGKKLDLSKLTDEEAKHVLEVIQRDFDLRKKEEDRLGELKTRIEREDIKRELLGNRTSLTESHCIRCLQAFKFLVNIKRQCLDCQLYVCRSCSHFNKNEQGWLCDPCHMTRVLKIGTLEWYHKIVRARFRRFGSAKVMHSLFKRLSGKHSCSQDDFDELPDYETQSMPDVYGLYDEPGTDAADLQHFRLMKKTKRRLTVDPLDFVPGHDHFNSSRGPEGQALHEVVHMDVPDMAVIFHQIVQNRRKSPDVEMPPQHDDLMENRSVPSRSASRLSYSSCGSSGATGPRMGSSFLPDLDGSEPEENLCQQFLMYQCHGGASSHTSEESLSAAPQIMDLNQRLSTIETLLTRLELKVTSVRNEDNQHPTPPRVSPPLQWEDVDSEEQQLRQKLHQMTDNISDHSLTSDDEESFRPLSSPEVPAWRSPQGDGKPSRTPTRSSSRTSTVNSKPEEEQTAAHKLCYSTDSDEKREPPLQDMLVSSFTGSTALLVELEDKVAQAAASVQSAKTEVSSIENRIAALNATGVPVDKRKRSGTPIQARRLSHNLPTSKESGNDAGLMRRRLSVM
ncbi:melanophilin isoform X1 [Oryzias latipes]|uniref:melanophilin isoform X1 n=1 Tax=Oryzias latipes TaxID=8090 RepID=UPI0005CBE55D|nr:melanophilin isoform X1 [Oryzias latipes]